MFGLSLSKVLFTILVVIAVWRAWKLWGPLVQRLTGGTGPARRSAQPQPRPEAPPLDLVACPHCGAYVPRTLACPSRAACRLPPA